MTKQYLIRPVQWLVVPEDDAGIYSEHALSVSIDDEGGGEYVRIKSESLAEMDKSVSFEREAWRELQRAVSQAIAQIEMHEGKGDD